MPVAVIDSTMASFEAEGLVSMDVLDESLDILTFDTLRSMGLKIGAAKLVEKAVAARLAEKS